MVDVNWIGLYTLIRREVERLLFRLPVQVILSPLVSASLFILTFGFILGRKIDLIAGVSYIEFVFPGILTMNIIGVAFEHTSSAVYFARFIKNIEELLVAPFSYMELIAGYVISAILRALIIAFGIVGIGILFGAVAFVHPGLFVLYTIAIATIFALLGIIIGLWAKSFEQFGLLGTFVLTPLSFLGGIFYSISFLPDTLMRITLANPFFYFIDGMRYSMIGITESNLSLGVVIIVGLASSLGGLVWYLFKISWRLRD
ncbi:MAG TPA: ABC transporter permease [Candidatus Paceibacterota bacterium]|jgi:ABC-2 type transport system permease protein